jgi:hypothetical protein
MWSVSVHRSSKRLRFVVATAGGCVDAERGGAELFVAHAQHRAGALRTVSQNCALAPVLLNARSAGPAPLVFKPLSPCAFAF